MSSMDHRMLDVTQSGRSLAKIKSARQASSTRHRSSSRQELHRSSDVHVEVSLAFIHEKTIGGEKIINGALFLSARSEWRKLIPIEDNQTLPFRLNLSRCQCEENETRNILYPVDTIKSIVSLTWMYFKRSLFGMRLLIHETKMIHCVLCDFSIEVFGATFMRAIR